MNKVTGISLSSSERDHKAVFDLCGNKIFLERIGTNGDFLKARNLFELFDGKTDAFGLGGIDLSLGIGKYRYRVKDAFNLVKGIKTPVFDGNGLKHVLDAHAIDYLVEKKKTDFKGKQIFMVCACNRYGMAKKFEEYGCKMVYGDFMFGLKLPVPVKSLKTGAALARCTLPIATRLPHSFLYPIGKKQAVRNPKFTKYFEQADIIAGDYHYIYKYSPKRLYGKIIITTTTTSKDVKYMKEKGISCLVTTTPEIDGRSFASNILEAALYSINKRNLTERELNRFLSQLKPTIKYF